MATLTLKEGWLVSQTLLQEKTLKQQNIYGSATSLNKQIYQQCPNSFIKQGISRDSLNSYSGLSQYQAHYSTFFRFKILKQDLRILRALSQLRVKWHHFQKRKSVTMGKLVTFLDDINKQERKCVIFIDFSNAYCTIIRIKLFLVMEEKEVLKLNKLTFLKGLCSLLHYQDPLKEQEKWWFKWSFLLIHIITIAIQHLFGCLFIRYLLKYELRAEC
ncbi:unnamed protein product (macronuclear) [Paramecium tetraurelia]|uniref:Transmembrane protein n=1 Tax=Paramecium tetraurelia TaxID=5888 RepID=A0C1T4_PARTE|nr:uncharacterized protein GSPATT00034228001 [Paramecium tetraurelia]CAK64751.1 unnamed protein product [Paramecium tetraurelia]|eukprot:XP_001432148.1 hypothetical protein (macronuclear) [Paramecium tetraurelia strain d4-2]